VVPEIGWTLGVRDKTIFWEDAWGGRVNLKSMIPRLFSISLDQKKKVGEVGKWLESEWQWRLR